jgi:hypothetical protein
MDKKFYTTYEVLKMFRITRNQLEYLFNSHRLDKEKYQVVGNQRIFKPEEIPEIRKALDSVAIYS